MKFIVLLGVIFSLLFILNKEDINHNKMSYSQALKMAQKSNRLIMIKLTSDHCKYCIKMDKEVMVDKEVQKLLSQYFITVNINVDKEKIPLGIKRTITPTFIFVDKNQKIVSKIPGSWNKRDFMDLLEVRI